MKNVYILYNKLKSFLSECFRRIHLFLVAFEVGSRVAFNQLKSLVVLLFICVVHLSFLGRFAIFLWLLLLLCGTLVALLILLYGWFYGKWGLRGAFFFSAKWTCKTLLLLVLSPVSLVMSMVTLLHFALFVFCLLKPLLVKLVVYTKPVYAWIEDTYVYIILNLIEEIASTYELGFINQNKWLISQLSNNVIIFLVTLFLFIVLCACLLLLRAFENLTYFYARKWGVFLAWFYKVAREQERADMDREQEETEKENIYDKSESEDQAKQDMQEKHKHSDD